MLEYVKAQIGCNNHHAVTFETNTFPAGEVYLKITNVDDLKKCIHDSATVTLVGASPRIIMEALLLGDALRQMGVNNIMLKVDYFPYGRQDRVCSEGEPFSLKVFTDILIGSFDSIQTVDPHSDVTRDLTCLVFDCPDMSDVYHNGFYINTRNNVISKLPPLGNHAIVIAPDKGAAKRAQTFLLASRAPITGDEITISKINAEKTRTPEGIYITIADEYLSDLKGFTGNIWVPDDICDGGGTFIVLAAVIKRYAPDAKLNLVLSHGIFSQGVGGLHELYDNIYVLDNDYNSQVLIGLKG